MASEAVLEKGADSGAVLRLRGGWTLNAPLEDRKAVIGAFSAPSFRHVVFMNDGITEWDSTLVALLVHLIGLCRKNDVSCGRKGLPDGVDQLIDLALKVPARAGAERTDVRPPFLARVGQTSLDVWETTKKAFRFIRESNMALGRFIHKQAVMRKTDLLLALQEAGFDALGIVSLICFMVGLILAFVGAVQLKMFGAQIYVASLVAIAMSRVMGAVMAGIIMAGRTGSSYAAVLGSMQVNEEIDALETMGVSPFDFLVLPRLLALSLMMPLLTVYADFMGIMGGAFVGIFMLDLSPQEYFKMTFNALSMKNIIIGIVHGSVFGVIISLCGCYQGIMSGRSASSVGRATTAAVVNSIVGIIIATAIITFICDVIGV